MAAEVDELNNGTQPSQRDHCSKRQRDRCQTHDHTLYGVGETDRPIAAQPGINQNDESAAHNRQRVADGKHLGDSQPRPLKLRGDVKHEGDQDNDGRGTYEGLAAVVVVRVTEKIDEGGQLVLMTCFQ